ncbi:haloacid dehalogenase-like hydrolase domain-containing protein 3 [Glandiceps talaboti]
MAASGCKLLTIDITKTIMHVRVSVGYQYTRIATQMGFQFYQESALTTAFNEQYAKLIEERPKFDQQDGSISVKDWWKLLIKKTFIHAYSGYENVDLEPVADKLYHEFSTANCYDLYPEVRDVVPKLKDKGFKLCAVSNADARFRNVLEELDVMKYFDDVILSSEVKSYKPNPEIFKLALERLGVKSSESIHIGDSLENDYKGATNIGMSAYLVDREGKYDNCPEGLNKDHVLKDLSSLLDILKS